ncbi:tetratricopeptide repeat protein [Brachyspira pilosicoli]|uniref:tetratricopeptide repeat protein n=1 Tax=Brachyspira pilosicoli TaxID=52584 RepID=UPI00242CA8D1|nr:tetratricopeptide repeat protein [Brachyspira pilosicoli]
MSESKENQVPKESNFLHRYYNIFFIILFIISLLSFSIIYFHHTKNVEKRFDNALKSYEQSLSNIFNNLSIETNNYTNESIVPNTSSSCTRDRISINNNNIMNVSEGDGFDELEKSFEIGLDLLKASLSEIMKNSNDVLTFWFAFLSVIMVVFTFAGILINNNVLEQSKIQLKFVEKEAQDSIKNIKEETKIEIQKLIDENNKNIQISNLFNLGIQAINTKNYIAAESYFSGVINLDNSNSEAYNNRGVSKDSRGKHDEAIEDYNEAIKLNPNYSEAYNNRGVSKNSNGKYDEAIEDYNEAIKLNPNNSEAYNNRATSKYKLTMYKEALEDYNKAIDLNPNKAEYYFGKGTSYSKLGFYKDALENYDKAIELNPNYSEAYNNRGVSKNSNGKYDEAIEDYNKAIKLNPNYSEAYNNRGNAKKNLGILSNNMDYIEKAIKDYNMAIKLNTNNSEVYFNRYISKSLLLEKIVDKNSEEYKKSFDDVYNDLYTAYSLANEQLKVIIKNQVINMAKSENKVEEKFCKEKDWNIN